MQRSDDAPSFLPTPKGGGFQTADPVMITPFASLEQAWPFIRRLIKIRLRRGYQIVLVSPRNCP